MFSSEANFTEVIILARYNISFQINKLFITWNRTIINVHPARKISVLQAQELNHQLRDFLAVYAFIVVLSYSSSLHI